MKRQRWLRTIVIVAGLVLFALAGGIAIGIALARGEERIELPAPVESRLAPQPYTLPLEYAQLVIYECDRNDVPVWLVCRLFDWESGWRARMIGAENENGTRDYGLAQLNSAYLSHFKVFNNGLTVDPFNPEHAIRVGVRYLAALYAEHGSWREAIRKYAGNRSRAATARIMGDAR